MLHKALFYSLGLTSCVLCSAVLAQAASQSTGYSRLLGLYDLYRQDFRVSDNGSFLESVSRESIAEQREGLAALRAELDVLNWQDFEVSQQIDFQLVRAEAAGLDFAHRITKPWFRDPGYYADFARGLVPRGEYPPTTRELARIGESLKQWPGIVANAQKNLMPLAEVPSDLGHLAVRSLTESAQALMLFSTAFGLQHPELLPLIDAARDATLAYSSWLVARLPEMRGEAGVGRENYDWLLRNVYLMPYSWADIERIIELEDNRVVTFQKLEEVRNRGLPVLEPVQSQEDYRASVRESVDHLFEFIETKRLFSMPGYLTDEEYFGSWHGFDGPWPKRHDYFFNFSHRESLMEEAHEMVGHHFDELRAENHPHLVRSGWRPHKISTARTEGFAFALEELLIYAGYLDHRSPRAREVAYEQAAFRTVRAMADLRMHSGEWSLKDAMDYAISNAPHGELLDNSDHLWFEMGTTLRGVGHHALMVIGKVQFMKLFRDVAHAEGDQFSLHDFMDQFFASGLIPFSLIRWEMTGMTDEVNNLW